MKASYRGHVKVVDTLIEHEAILDLKTTKGHTALALSILHQQPPVVSRLVIAGANTGIKDKVHSYDYLYNTHTVHKRSSCIIGSVVHRLLCIVCSMYMHG